MIACCMMMLVHTKGEADVFGLVHIGFESGSNAYVSGGSVRGWSACMSVVCLMKWMVLVPLGIAAAWIQSLRWFKPYSSDIPV